MTSLEYTPTTTIRLLASCAMDVDRAARLLADQKIVALPTETVYGLAANGLDAHAISKIFVAKGRPLNNPLIMHVHDIDAAFRLLDFHGDQRARERFFCLASTFWPGPLTIIAKAAIDVPRLATAGLDTVAVRIPKNRATRDILKQLGFPLVMPSANMSTRPSPTCAEHVLATLDGRIDAVLDDGTCDVGIESTVVRIDTDEVAIARPGMIDARMVRACLNESVLESANESPAVMISPGQASLHYSPKVRSVKVCTRSEASTFWLSTDSFLIRSADYNSLTNTAGSRPKNTHCYLMSDDPQVFARELYLHLYDAERDPNQSLVIVIPDNDVEGFHAVIDRIKRTARA